MAHALERTAAKDAADEKLNAIMAKREARRQAPAPPVSSPNTQKKQEAFKGVSAGQGGQCIFSHSLPFRSCIYPRSQSQLAAARVVTSTTEGVWLPSFVHGLL